MLASDGSLTVQQSSTLAPTTSSTSTTPNALHIFPCSSPTVRQTLTHLARTKHTGLAPTVITKLGKKLNFRQRVIATAIVFFRRFYIKNAYCETDPFVVIAACCYVAGKAEESPVHIKNIVAEARLFFSRTSTSFFHAQSAWLFCSVSWACCRMQSNLLESSRFLLIIQSWRRWSFTSSRIWNVT